MRTLAILLGAWLGCASLFGQSADETAAGLRKLREVCFPKVRTARFVECAWLSDVPAVAQVWPNSLGHPYRAWLVNETPTGGTLFFANAVPIEVVFDDKPGTPFSRVRCKDVDLTKHLHDLESEIQDDSEPALLGSGLLFAVLADISGSRGQAVKYAQAILSKSPDMATPVATALNFAAQGQYAGCLDSYQRTADLAAFRRDCEALMKRFPEGWPALPALPAILSALPAGNKPAARPNLSEEDQKLLDEIVSYVPSETAVLRLNSLIEYPWLFELPPGLDSSPLERLLKRGPAAITFFAAVCDSELPIHFVGGQEGLHGMESILSMDPQLMESAPEPEYLSPILPRPLTVGQMSRLFLASALQLQNRDPDAASARAAAEQWVSRYGKFEGSELLRVQLEGKTQEEQYAVLLPLINSEDVKWLPAYEKFVDDQPATMLTLQIAMAFAQRSDKRFLSIPRKFLAKLKSKDDLLPEYINSMPEGDIRSYRQHIDQQLDIIRKAVGEPEPTPPSA